MGREYVVVVGASVTSSNAARVRRKETIERWTRRLDGRGREALAACLKLFSSWEWPLRVLTEAAATDLCRLGVASLPVQPEPGEVLLVGVRDGIGVLMHTCDAAAKDVMTLSSLAVNRGWDETVGIALASLDWMLTPFPLRRPLQVASLGGGQTAPLDGDSYRLAFALSHVSMAIAQPVPADVVALANVSADGGLRPVNGLAEKIGAILVGALYVSRVFVARQNESEVRALLADVEPPVHVEAHDQLRDVIHAVWPVLEEQAAERLNDAVLCSELIDEFYEQALERSDRYLRWSAIETTLARMPEERLDSAREWKRRFAIAVARRHDGKTDGIGAILADCGPFIASELRPAYRTRLEASLIQCAMDAGEDVPFILRESIDRIYTQFQSSPETIRRGELKVLGAWNRILVRDGDLEPAADLSKRLSYAWLAYRHRDGDEVSHPLSILYRLAGLMGDNALFEAADDLREKFRGYFESFEHWVIFARARALVLLGRHEDALSTFCLLNTQALPTWLVASVRRWHLRLLRATGEDVPVTCLDAALRTAAGDVHGLALFGALARLDDANARDDFALVDAALSTLRERNPAMTRRLEQRVPPGWITAKWVADAYPD